MSNHKIDDEEEEMEEEEEVEKKVEKKDTKSPVAEALRSPAPPMDNEEYYYYEAPAPARAPAPPKPKPAPKYPNFPPAKKPVAKYENKYEDRRQETRDKYEDKYKQKPVTPTKSYTHKRPEAHKKESSYKPRKPSSSHHKSPYNIESTLKRLQEIKKNNLKRKGVPALPNPWEKINSSPKSDSRKSIYDRKSKPKP